MIDVDVHLSMARVLAGSNLDHSSTFCPDLHGIALLEICLKILRACSNANPKRTQINSPPA